MVGEGYPHHNSVDEIDRICHLPIMRIQVVTPVRIDYPAVQKCSIMVKCLGQEDLEKLGAWPRGIVSVSTSMLPVTHKDQCLL